MMLDKHRATSEERAFPVPVGVVAADMQGLSLRDWFAGQALAGRCANESQNDTSYADIASSIYKQADAAMEVRKTQG